MYPDTASISIIICTRDRAASLRDTLRSLAGVAVPAGTSVELIVVDNGSRDDTRDVVAGARLAGVDVRYMFEGRPGKARALNRAVRESRGDVLVFSDDDVRMPAGWLDALVRPIAAGRLDAVQGGVRMAPHLERPWMTTIHRVWLACVDGDDADEVPSLIGANMAVARDVLTRVPAFDEELGPGQLGFAEDNLFTSQLKVAGFRLGRAREATVEHHFDGSRLIRAGFLSIADRIGRSDAYVAHHWRHEEAPRAWEGATVWAGLNARRLARPRAWTSTDFAADWELARVARLAFIRQMRIEARRPRKYEKHELVKRGAPPSGDPTVRPAGETLKASVA